MRKRRLTFNLHDRLPLPDYFTQSWLIVKKRRDLRHHMWHLDEDLEKIHLVVGLVVQNPPANSGDPRGEVMDLVQFTGLQRVGHDWATELNWGDECSVPKLGRCRGIGNGNPLQFLAWEIPWTEKPGRLWFMGSQRIRHDWVTERTFVRCIRDVPWFLDSHSFIHISSLLALR